MDQRGTLLAQLPNEAERDTVVKVQRGGVVLATEAFRNRSLAARRYVELVDTYSSDPSFEEWLQLVGEEIGRSIEPPTDAPLEEWYRVGLGPVEVAERLESNT